MQALRVGVFFYCLFSNWRKEMTTITEKDRLLDAQDLGRLLGVKPRTVRAWAVKGVIPSISITSKVRRFDPIAVRAHLENQEV